MTVRFRRRGVLGLRRLLLWIVQRRNIWLIWIATILPISFLVVQQATLYDGIRHTLFVIPALAVIAGGAAVGLWQLLGGRLRSSVSGFATIYGACLLADLVILHPLGSVPDPLAPVDRVPDDLTD